MPRFRLVVTPCLFLLPLVLSHAPEAGAVVIDGVDRGPDVVISTDTSSDVSVSDADTFEVAAGGRIASLFGTGASVVRITGGTVADPFATDAQLSRTGTFRGQVRLLNGPAGSSFEMTAGQLIGVNADQGQTDTDFPAPASGLAVLGSTNIRISGGTIRGGNQVNELDETGRPRRAAIGLQILGLSAEDQGQVVIDGGQFIGGSSITQPADPSLGVAGAPGVNISSVLPVTINGGVFQGGDSTALTPFNFNAGSPGLYLHAAGNEVSEAADINGGVFRKGALPNDRGGSGFDFDYSIVLGGGKTVNLRGGDLEDVLLFGNPTLNVYASSFELDGTVLDVTRAGLAVDQSDGEITVDFLGQGLETFDFRRIGGSINFILVPEPATATFLVLASGALLRRRGDRKQ